MLASQPKWNFFFFFLELRTQYISLTCSIVQAGLEIIELCLPLPPKYSS